MRLARLAQALAVASLVLACEPPAPKPLAESAASAGDRAPATGIATSTPAPLSASGSARAAPPASSSALGAAPVPMLYAELFRQGAELRLRVKTRRSAEGKTTLGQQRASCKVVSVEVLADRTQSRVTCTGMPDVDVPDPLSGIWTFSAGGLFHHGPEDDAPLRMDEHHVVFVPGPEPTPRNRPTVPQDDAVRLSIEKKGDAWCSTRDFGEGDPAWSSICVGEGAGVRSGKWGWTGGTTHEAEFAREP